MKKFHLLLLLSFIAFASSAQQNSIKGIITDTLNKQKLQNVVVSLLHYNDSVLYRFTRTNEKGEFELNNLQAGKYVMLLTYPTYASMMDSITVANNSHLQLNNLALITKEQILQEVVVKQHIAPVRFKNDTLEIIADSFKVRAGASVEDLIRNFPGFTVDSKGNITTQGQKIEKVLVDGDEFFGDDPTLATQNLAAKDVAKVQVYDRKSDQATLTGIDDGQKQKTMNLILKDDAKKGYFGKVEAGSDFNKYYQAKATANKFTANSKAGVYFSADKTGKNGMSWNEMQDFNPNVTTGVTDDGGIFISAMGDGFDSYNTQGVPQNIVASAMFNQKFGKYKSNTVNNYTFKDQIVDGSSTTNSTYILPDTIYYNNQANDFHNSKWQHTLSTRNELNLDSSNTFNINAKGSWGNTSQNNHYTSEYLSSDKQKVNTSLRNTTSSGNNDNERADLFYKRKFNKAGTRILNLSGSYINTNSNTNGFVYNETDFYHQGNIDSTQIVDQKKINTSSSVSYSAIASYTEPITKKLSLNINYNFGTNNSNQNVSSYNKTASGNYDSLDLFYSNHFSFINTSHKGGLLATYNNKKLYAQIGFSLQGLSLNEKNLYTDSSLHRNFTNFFPRANFRYKFSQSANLYLSYNGYTNTPSLSAIQPLTNNTDPLNITIGNPDLKPSFTHSINFYYSSYKVLTGRNLFINGYFSTTENAFTGESNVDELGRRISQTVNVNGNYNYRFSLNYGRKIKFMQLSLSFGPSFNGSRNISYVNNLQNTTNNYNASMDFSISKYVDKKFDFYLRYSPNYNHSVSSINTNAVTDYWTHTISNYFSYKILKGWNFISDIDANLRQKINATDQNTNTVVWNASVERKLFKKKSIYAIVSVNDILNQNIGFSRNVSSNFITENTYTTVQRYFLISLRWNFAKNRKIDEDDE